MVGEAGRKAPGGDAQLGLWVTRSWLSGEVGGRSSTSEGHAW